MGAKVAEQKPTSEEIVGEAKWTQSTRDDYYKEHPENFADSKNRAYPIKDRSDVRDAVRIVGQASNKSAVKKKIISIAKRLGFTDALPDDWVGTAKEADENSILLPADASPSKPSGFLGKPRLATITTCFLEDDAISKNGRQYPKEVVDRLIQSAQEKLESNQGSPLTCFVRHMDAADDDALRIGGRITRVWRENHRAMASIDIPDTSAGRDIVNLGLHGYMKTTSLRAENAQIYVDPNKSYPQVGGNTITLAGIDFTTRPGIENARFENVQLAEQADDSPCNLNEVFTIPEQGLLVEEEEAIGEFAPTPSLPEPKSPESVINEDEPTQQTPLVVGESSKHSVTPCVPAVVVAEVQKEVTEDLSPSTTSNEPLSDYTKRTMPVPAIQGSDMRSVPIATLKEAHDHAANLLGMPCSHEGTQESGKMLNRKNQDRIGRMHDLLAKGLEYDCSYEDLQKNLSTDDSNTDEESSGNNTNLTNEEDNPMQKGKEQQQQQTTQQESNQRVEATVQESARTPVQEAYTPVQGSNQPVNEANTNSSQIAPELAAQLLEQLGWKLERPKTELELLREDYERRLAEQQSRQEQQFSELKEMFQKLQTQAAPPPPATPAPQQQQPAPQRQTMVEGANTTTQSPYSSRLYKNGDYIREQLQEADLYQIADRSAPLSNNIKPEFLLKEFSTILFNQIVSSNYIGA